MNSKSTTAATPKSAKTVALAKAEPRVSALTLFREADEMVGAALMKVAQALSNDPKPEAVALIYHTLKTNWGKTLEDNINAAKSILASHVEAAGEPTENGKGKATELEYNGRRFRASTTKSFSTLPDVAKLEKLLDQKGLSMLDACIKEIRYVPDDRKLAELVDQRKLTQGDIESCRKVTATTTKIEAL